MRMIFGQMRTILKICPQRRPFPLDRHHVIADIGHGKPRPPDFGIRFSFDDVKAQIRTEIRAHANSKIPAAFGYEIPDGLDARLAQASPCPVNVLSAAGLHI